MATVEVNIHFYAEVGSTLADLDTVISMMQDVLKDEHNWKFLQQHPQGNTIDTDIKVMR